MSDPLDMPEPLYAPEHEDPFSAEPVKKGHPIIAWMVILLLVGLSIVVRYAPLPAELGKGEDRLSLSIAQLTARYAVGAAEFGKEKGREVLDQLKPTLDRGTVDQRLRYVVLTGELAGPEQALNELDQLDAKLVQAKLEMTLDQARIRDILGRLYEDYAAGDWTAPSVPQPDREFLKEHLDWFGELALAPRQGPDAGARESIISSAQRTVFALVGALIFGGLLGVAGLVALVVFLALFLAGQLRHLRSDSLHGGVYAETFAVWFVLLFALQIATGMVWGREENLILSASVTDLLSLLALFWPVLRGIPWRQVREDIGLTAGRNPAVEPLIGVVNYVLSLPLLGIGLLLTLLLMHLFAPLEEAQAGGEFDPVSLPNHPIIPFLSGNDWSKRLQVLFLASVVAPIVEETMFRGVLYRHLREGTGKLGFVASAFLSAVVVSFIFAVIHPQGLLFVPPLMGLAFGFALVREWRGTLIPSMIAHGINNALVLTVGILTLGS